MVSSVGCYELMVERKQKVFVVHNESPREIYVTPDLHALKKFQKYVYKTGVSLGNINNDLDY